MISDEYVMVYEVDQAADYEFDVFGVFRKDDELFYTTDRGCSCYAPWDDISDADLIPVANRHELIAAFEGWASVKEGKYSWGLTEQEKAGFIEKLTRL